MTLGNRIKLARERLTPRLTQRALGDVFGISDKAVSSWERGDSVPEPDKLPALRRKLRVTYVWLLEGTGAPPAQDDPRVLMDDIAPAEWAALAPKSEPPRHKRAGNS